MFLLSSIHIYYGNAYIYQLYFSIYMHVLVDDSWMDEASKYMVSFKIGYVWTIVLTTNSSLICVMEYNIDVYIYCILHTHTQLI